MRKLIGLFTIILLLGCDGGHNNWRKYEVYHNGKCDTVMAHRYQYFDETRTVNFYEGGVFNNIEYFKCIEGYDLK